VKLPPQDLFAQMNKTERHRAIQLEAMKRDGQIRDWGFEAMSLKLGRRSVLHTGFHGDRERRHLTL
jgi:hypothetical protein